ncbi:MAG: alanine dehydrogenase [Actinomycetota bacterium]
MRIGVPSEVKTDEYRVALTPAGARELVARGHEVVIERGAGVGSSISDQAFETVGATMVASAQDVWATADLVLKVKEPIASEYPLLGLRSDQVLFTYLHLAASRACTDALIGAGNVAIAYETVRAANGSLPLLTPMSEVAGRMATMQGAHHLMRSGGGRGVLISGVPGVARANVVVLGAGVAGMAAATMAAGLGARVAMFDRNLDRLREVDEHFAGRVETFAASTHAIEVAVKDADLVIGAVLVVGAKAPKLVTDAMVATMRPGSVLVDISVDQGGCFESTRPTTHSDPVFHVHGSLFYCVANMPGGVPATSTQALANATLPFTLELADRGWLEAVRRDPALAGGVNVVRGTLTSAPVAEAHGLSYAALETFF